MNYEKIYNSLMQSRKSRGLDKSKLDFVTECHHIVPRCLGGSDKESNLVLLTGREHYVAHLLLTKLTVGNAYHKMLTALSTFQMDKFGVRCLNSRQIGKAREATSLRMHDLAAQGLHPAQSEDNRKANSERVLALIAEGTHNFQDQDFIDRRDQRLATGTHNLQQSEHIAMVTEVQQSLVLEGKHHWLSSSHRERTSQRMTELAAEGLSPFQSDKCKAMASERQQTVTTCPHCGKMGKGSSMYVWHFDNCKEVKSRLVLSIVCPHCGKVGTSPGLYRWHFDNCLDNSLNKGLNRKQIADRLNCSIGVQSLKDAL